MATPLDTTDSLTGVPITDGKLRVPNATEARKLSSLLLTEDANADYMRKLVKAQLKGSKPFPSLPPDLAWMPNINFLELAATINNKLVPYAQLLNVYPYVTLDVDWKSGDPENKKWTDIIARRFHEMVLRWPEWFWNYNFKDQQSLTHGIGICIRNEYPDWRFQSVECGAVKVPSQTRSHVGSELPYVCVFVPSRVHLLFERIKDEEAAEKRGWKVQNVKDLLRSRLNKGSWSDAAQQLTDCDLTAASGNDVIRLVIMYVKEADGKISHLIFTENADTSRGEKADGFLFASKSKLENYNEALVAFFHEIGADGYWHDVIGIGQKTYSAYMVRNQQKCRMLALSDQLCGLTVQLGDTRSKDAVILTRRGLTTFIPPGVKLQPQVHPAGVLDGPITVDRVFGNMIVNNIGETGGNMVSRDDGKGEVPTATQINYQATVRSSLSDAQLELHSVPLDALLAGMMQRALIKGTSDEEAQRFQKECIADGVPEQALRNVINVKFNRIGRYGSTHLRQQSDQMLLQSGAVSAMPPEGQAAFWRDFVAGQKGVDKTTVYFPEQQQTSQDEWTAVQENASIRQGIQSPVIGDNLVHATVHLQDVEDFMAPVRDAIESGQRDPQQIMDAMRYIQTMAPHLDAHIAACESNPVQKAAGKMFREKFAFFVSFDGKLRAALREVQREAQIAAQEQQQAVSLGALDEAKLRSIQNKDQIATVKAQSDMARKDAKARQDMAIKDAQTAQDIRIKAVKQ